MSILARLTTIIFFIVVAGALEASYLSSQLGL